MKSGYDNPISAFLFSFSQKDTVEDIRKRLERVKTLGYKQIIVTYQSPNGLKQVPFDEIYFGAVDHLVEACRAENMPFWIPDFTAFPTGSAGCVLETGECPQANKMFIDERHLDFYGPMEHAVVNVESMRKIAFSKAAHQFKTINVDARNEIALVAYRLQENPDNAAAPFLEEDTAILLDEYVKDGFLTWDIPEGQWRISTVFTTHESSGRAFYVNLLSKESVALEIEKVHKPIYEHLKDELGTLWYGYFYDEPEVGNNGGSDVFDFYMLPGKRSRYMDDCEVYSWSPEMPAEMEKRDKDWKKKLLCLFYDGIDSYKDFRCTYMDAVSALIQENYGRQVYEFCHDRGIHYFGHSLEDENSHTRLGCGLGHYFRHQYYQDEAGIDVIAGQILPGRDRAATWYGAANADGEFYHYGLAKLASSEANINPIKRHRSVVECFALYGQQSLAGRKFVLDHIMVNGVNRMYLMDEGCYSESPEYSASLIDYCDEFCGVMYTSGSEIKTAVLYHAEAEWREGEKAQKFQRPAAVLARNQISYDVVPADVFTYPERYDAFLDGGLVINGHAYQALVIPACEKIPESVADFVRKSKETGFPVFFVDRIPVGMDGMVESCDSVRCSGLSELASLVKQKVMPDIEVESARKEWFRYLHVTRGEEQFYFIHNEAPCGSADAVVKMKGEGEALIWDMMSGRLFRPQQQAENGWIKASLSFGQYEMKAVYLPGAKKVEEPVITVREEKIHKGSWVLEFPDGYREISDGSSMPRPEEHVGYGFYGRLVYRTSFTQDGGKLPSWLDLGAVSDCCEVFLNGKSLGKRVGTPYLFEVEDMLPGKENRLVIEVYASAGNIRTDHKIFGIPVDSFSGVPYSMVLPMGIMGPVKWLYE